MASGSNPCPKVEFVRSPYVLGLKSPQTQGKVDYDHLLITARITPKSKKDMISFEVSNDKRFKKEESDGYEDDNTWVVPITISALAKTPDDKRNGDAFLQAMCENNDKPVAKALVTVVVPTKQNQAWDKDKQYMTNSSEPFMLGDTLLKTAIGLNEPVIIRIYDQHNRPLSRIYDSDKKVVEERMVLNERIGGFRGAVNGGPFSNLQNGEAKDPIALIAEEAVPQLTNEEATKWANGKLNPKGFDGERLDGDNIFNFKIYRHLLGFRATQILSVHGWQLSTTYLRTQTANGPRFRQKEALIFDNEKHE